MLIFGAAGQFGIFLTLLLALAFGWLVVKWESVSGVLQRLVERLPARFQEKARTHTAAAMGSLQGLRRMGELRQLIFLSIWIWILSLLVNYLGLLSFNLALPITASLLLLVALRLGISAALTPAAIGVFEFLCVLSLAVFRVAPVHAFGFGVFLHAVVLLPHLVLGGAAMISLSLAGGRPAEHPSDLE